MNQQDVFDRVAKHLLTQKKRAVDEGDECQYQAPDGCQCAIGCLIKPGQYKGVFEGREIKSLIRGLIQNGVKISDIFYFDIEEYGEFSFLRNLQNIHDDLEISTWKDALEKFGQRYNLDTAVLNAF